MLSTFNRTVYVTHLNQDETKIFVFESLSTDGHEYKITFTIQFL